MFSSCSCLGKGGVEVFFIFRLKCKAFAFFKNKYIVMQFIGIIITFTLFLTIVHVVGNVYKNCCSVFIFLILSIEEQQ